MSDMPKMPEIAGWRVASWCDCCAPEGEPHLADCPTAVHAAWQAYVAQLRAQVMGCVPDAMTWNGDYDTREWTEGYNDGRRDVLANLQALFGERQDD